MLRRRVIRTVMSNQAETGKWSAQPPPRNVADAFAYCERIARAHYENFPVGSLLAPRERRRHVYSIYAFARTADDFADEDYETGDLTEARRLAALDDWERKLEACYLGAADHPIFVALAETVRELDLPMRHFCDLLSAFRQDVVKRRYADFDEVMEYCSRSANPVGRLILLLFGYREERLHELSDCVCSALQLTNFWQDVEVDIRKDRVYLPQNEMARFGVGVDDLREKRFTENYAALLKFQVERTWELFNRGKSLPDQVSGRLALELRLTWLGGTRILERIEKIGYDTLNARPKISTAGKMALLVKALRRFEAVK